MNKKTALITGSSRGIGHATAQTFLKEGWKVIGTSTSGKVDIKNPDFIPKQLDLKDEKSISSLTSWIKEEEIKIDALVNNSGILLDWDDEVTDIPKLRETLEVNLIGAIALTESLLANGLINSPGKIINVSSQAASINESFGAYMPTYKISKIGLNMYTRTLAARLSSQNIDVYSIDPGWVKTDMGGSGASREPEEPAREIYELATSDKETGLFYLRGEPREW